jgi:hypothetical protein
MKKLNFYRDISDEHSSKNVSRKQSKIFVNKLLNDKRALKTLNVNFLIK